MSSRVKIQEEHLWGREKSKRLRRKVLTLSLQMCPLLAKEDMSMKTVWQFVEAGEGVSEHLAVVVEEG